MALLGPGVPSKGTPRSRARGLVWADMVVINATSEDENGPADLQTVHGASSKVGSITDAKTRRVALFGAL